MRQLNLDLDVMCSFVTGIELGSFAKAADRLGRSTSAVSAQLNDWQDEPLPLVAFEAPCLMRNAAAAALDRAGIAWRLAFSSASLSGIWAAVAAGLGITIRTSAGLPAQLQVLTGMPELPRIGLLLHRAEAEPNAVVKQLEAP